MREAERAGIARARGCGLGMAAAGKSSDIFGCKSTVRTILEREELPPHTHRLSHVSSIAAASNTGEARFILYESYEWGLFYRKIGIRDKSNFSEMIAGYKRCTLSLYFFIFLYHFFIS